ncbi:hypothetical protein [Ramlibacter tataouinensis]|uniref:hypothetical protein n=1 Tax=Ramlibacter tataouinensis TaxID=94132 RepID=UPI0002FC80E4|nr:hypothetical protein [Ramlibacter tataouinensis]
MTSLPRRALRAAFAAGLIATATCGLGGCAVIAVVDTAAGLAVSGVGLAADAAIGTVRLTGKAVGAAADLAIPDGDGK